MQSDQQRRKRKRFLHKPTSSSFLYCLLLFFFFSFFFFNARPLLLALRSTHPFLSKHQSFNSTSFPLLVQDRIVFPDHVLLLVSNKNLLKQNGKGVDCVYRSNFTAEIRGQIRIIPVLSVDDYDESRSIARCPLPPANYSYAVTLTGEEERDVVDDEHVHSWDLLAYAAQLDRKTAVVFVKGLNLRPDRVSDPTQINCHFNWGNSNRSSKYELATNAVTAAQEVVRCALPISLQNNPAMAQGVQVSVSLTTQPVRRGRGRRTAPMPHPPISSVAKLHYSNDVQDKDESKYELCACTMLWNQASALREWILYHAWLGVQRCFIYDNNSDDGINEVIHQLQRENYNVSRHVWPWIKTQEAGFSHCTLKARKECKWLAFMDVDEFFYFPPPTTNHKTNELQYPGRDSLLLVVANFSTSVGEIRTVCHSFGPSGLNSAPPQGVTAGYTCRLQSPERHKSIVRLDALDDTLLNVVHHFHLKEEYTYLNLPQSTATINHYKYQVWQVFRAKFFRRVATYVTDWQENQNEGSKDRAPGLGTEAIEPPNWSRQFCEVWDTGLRDFVMAYLADPVSGLLPWDKTLGSPPS